MDFRERQAVKNQIASFCTLDSCYYIGVSCVPCFLNMRNAIDAIPSLTSIWFVLDSIHSILEVGENHEKMMNTFWSIPVTSSVLSSLPFFLRSFFSFPYLFWARVPIIFLSFPSVDACDMCQEKPPQNHSAVSDKRIPHPFTWPWTNLQIIREHLLGGVYWKIFQEKYDILV